MLSVLRAALLVSGLSPVVLGLNMVLSPAGTTARLAKLLNGARVDTSDEHRVGVIYTGLYIVALGCLLLGAAYDPAGQGDVIRVGGLLFLMRGIQRYYRADELTTAYGVKPAKNWMHVAWLSSMGLALIVLAPYAPPAPGAQIKVTYALRQIALGLMCLHSVAVGALLAVWPNFGMELCASMSGAAKMPRSAQFHYIVQPLGVYMIAFGLLAGVAQVPGAVPRLSGALGALLVARAVARWFTSEMLFFSFGVKRRVLLWQALGLTLAGLLIAFGSTRP